MVYKEGVACGYSIWNNWNNWNWNAELPPCLLLLSKACGEATRYLYEFFGSPTAEL